MHNQSAAVADASAAATAAQVTLAAAAGAIATALCLAALVVLVLALRRRRRHKTHKVVSEVANSLPLPPPLLVYARSIDVDGGAEITTPRQGSCRGVPVGEHGTSLVDVPTPAHWACAMPLAPHLQHLQPTPPMHTTAASPGQQVEMTNAAALPPLRVADAAAKYRLPDAPPPRSPGLDADAPISLLTAAAAVAANPASWEGEGGIPNLRISAIGSVQPSRFDKEGEGVGEGSQVLAEASEAMVSLDSACFKAGAAALQAGRGTTARRSVPSSRNAAPLTTTGSRHDEQHHTAPACTDASPASHPQFSGRSAASRGSSLQEALQHPLLATEDAPVAAAPAPAPRVDGWGHALDWLLNEEEEEGRSKDAPVPSLPAPPPELNGASTQSFNGTAPAAASMPVLSWDSAPEASVDAEGAAGLDSKPSLGLADVPIEPAVAPDDDLDMLADVFFATQTGRGPVQAGGADWRSPGSFAEAGSQQATWFDGISTDLHGGAAVGSWFSGPRGAPPLSPASTGAVNAPAPLQSWGAAARRRAQIFFGDDADTSAPTSPSLRAPPLLLSPPHAAAAAAAAGASPPLLLARSVSLRTLPVSVRPASLLQLHSPGGLWREASQRSLLASPKLTRLGSSGREVMAEPAVWRATGYDSFVDEILDVERAGDEAAAASVASLPPLPSTLEDHCVSRPCGIIIGEQTEGLGGGSSSSRSCMHAAQPSLWSHEAAPRWQHSQPEPPRPALPPARNDGDMDDAVVALNF